MRNYVWYKKLFLKFFWCARLALRNDSGAAQKTNFIANVSLVRINQLHQSTAIDSDSKSLSTSDSKKQKKDPTQCCSRITSKKILSKAPKKFVVTIGCVIQISVKERTKMKESGAFKTNFSNLALK